MSKKSKKLVTRAATLAAPTHAAPGPARDRHLRFNERWNYSPAPEVHTDITIKPRYELFIGGKFVKPSSGKYFPSINPATEKQHAEIAQGTAADVDKAVKAARRAYEKTWGKMPGRERAKYLFRIARLLQEKIRDLAVIESLDGGKTIRESRNIDQPLVAAHFFYHAGWADKLDYAFPGRKPQPLGVAGQIIPWNFPLLMAAWKLAPALACGNTCVLK
ncbi:MAG: aldehyde dehydrogenase family protein, partial [Chthoniobacterales bacterium]